MTAPLLSVRDVHVSFGGVRAADGVDVEVRQGEVLAIIGPNGSGKTTFINLCTGYVKPHAGSIHLEGRDITRNTPRQITKLGIARAFQIPQLFTEHRVIDNLMLAVAARQGFWQVLAPLDQPAHRQRATALLEMVGLQDQAESDVATLPEGIRKLTDIALALALEPRLLLLDEPTAGVSSGEKFPLMDRLMNVLRSQGVTAVFVEHDMDLVRRYADRVIVWNQGKVVADGPPDEVMNDPAVLRDVVGVI
ncbi:ABC transporter ATP-binding protein [Lutibaculum baratangense]|uniref:Branched-chain amino acid transport ATP-binding protein LivG n=1 Tax=Lutibaculum baratangense AMV1 TaxID=631454 RepID=V4TAJ2_9HYPH|nr:ABC transporter ATP-binding protein [Lutibaculum baratangense]ESR23448.1 Branched-chain amino acid transport ATP-binding protein LivG [Lutibaculum baratangense AMV1]